MSVSAQNKRISLDDLERKKGADWADRIVEINHPPDRETFVRRLNIELDKCLNLLEADAEHQSMLDEEPLTKEVSRLLSCLGYLATAEENKRGGHADIVVTHPDEGWVWIVEGKIHGSYGELEEGLRQLVDRYTTGRLPYGALVVFVKIAKSYKVMEDWRAVVRDQALVRYLRDSDDLREGAFRSVHVHEATGVEFEARHVGVTLYFEPSDKSAVASRARKAGGKKKAKKAAKSKTRVPQAKKRKGT